MYPSRALKGLDGKTNKISVFFLKGASKNKILRFTLIAAGSILRISVFPTAFGVLEIPIIRGYLK